MQRDDVMSDIVVAVAPIGSYLLAPLTSTQIVWLPPEAIETRTKLRPHARVGTKAKDKRRQKLKQTFGKSC